jgi:hypothetical protein
MAARVVLEHLPDHAIAAAADGGQPRRVETVLDHYEAVAFENLRRTKPVLVPHCTGQRLHMGQR